MKVTRESFNLGVIVDYDLISTDIRVQTCRENMFQAVLSPSFASHSTTKGPDIQKNPAKAIKNNKAGFIVNVCPDRQTN